MLKMYTTNFHKNFHKNLNCFAIFSCFTIILITVTEYPVTFHILKYNKIEMSTVMLAITNYDNRIILFLVIIRI